MISQLASSGRVKKIFAHCLDGRNGGGIFAIGRVVQPKVNMTPLVPNQYVNIGFFFNHMLEMKSLPYNLGRNLSEIPVGTATMPIML